MSVGRIPALVVSAVAVALALSLAGCAHRVVRAGAIEPSVAARVVTRLQALRGLELREPVPMEVKSPQEVRGHLHEILERDFAADELRDLSRVYAALGLLEPDRDLHAAILELYSAQVAGFYDLDTRRLYLVDPPPVPTSPWLALVELVLRRDLAGEMLLAHELTHALQHQWTGALARSADPGEDDRGLALRAVVEGDATLAGFAAVLGGLDRESAAGLAKALGGVPAELEALLPEIPRLLRETLVFQYVEGSRFVAEAFRRGGWPGVDRLLRHPPLSTEQVLHPGRFFIRPDAPMRVSLGGLEDRREDPEWRLLEENTLGELGIRILLEGALDAERAAVAAYGWDGDRFAAFARGEELQLFWMSVWDRPQDAAELVEAIRASLAATHGGPSGERMPWTAEVRDARVLVTIGVPEAELAGRRERIWAETAIDVERHGLDFDLTAEVPGHATGAKRSSAAATRTTRPSLSSFRR